MFITLVDEKKGTEVPGLLVELTHDNNSRGTVFVLYPETKTFEFVHSVPNGPDNAYIDDDGKHGLYFKEGDPSNFPQSDEEDVDTGPEPDDEDTENTEKTW